MLLIAKQNMDKFCNVKKRIKAFYSNKIMNIRPDSYFDRSSNWQVGHYGLGVQFIQEIWSASPWNRSPDLVQSKKCDTFIIVYQSKTFLKTLTKLMYNLNILIRLSFKKQDIKFYCLLIFLNLIFSFKSLFHRLVYSDMTKQHQLMPFCCHRPMKSMFPLFSD